MHKQKLLGQIMGLAYLLNKNSDFQVFVDFSGHVNQITVRLCDDALNNLAESHIYLDQPDTETSLIEVGSQLSDILTTGEIDYSRLHKGKYGSREVLFLCFDGRYCDRDRGDTEQAH